MHALHMDLNMLFFNAFIEGIGIGLRAIAADPWPWAGIGAMMLGLFAMSAVVRRPRRRRRA